MFFWVIPRRLNFICRRFGKHCLFHLHRLVGDEFITYQPMKMEQTECSETSANKIQTPRNYRKENIQHTEHGESLKSRKRNFVYRVQGGSPLVSIPNQIHAPNSLTLSYI